MTSSSDDLAATVDSARQLDKRAIARLVRVFEDARPSAAPLRRQVIEQLCPSAEGPGLVIGITGAPGSGKSSLIARLMPELVGARDHLTVGVLAVDPSSQRSGGALLGDRTRMRTQPDERRTYFRSQASATELGGLAPASFQVCRLLSLLFDLVLVETVGIGQSELDIGHLADHVYLVVQPLGGDEIQYLKAGIIEIPDSFILNKCDEPSAATAYHQLRSSLSLARPFDEDQPPIHRTSARTGEGIGELAAAILALVGQWPAGLDRPDRSGGPGRPSIERDLHFLKRWVRDEWGRTGTRCLAGEVGDLAALYTSCGDFDRAQQHLDQLIRTSICRHNA